MAKVLKTLPVETVIGSRIYTQAKETKGCWLYSWSNCPVETPDWAKKWYLLKSEYPTNPGPTITVQMSAAK